MKKICTAALCLGAATALAASDIYSPETYIELRILEACVERIQPEAGPAVVDQQITKRAKAQGLAAFSRKTMLASDAHYEAGGNLLTEYGLYILTETESCVQKSLLAQSGETVFQGVLTYPGASLVEANAVTYRVLTQDTYETVLTFYRDELKDASLQEKPVTANYTIFSFLYNGDSRTLTVEKTPRGSDITIIGRP